MISSFSEIYDQQWGDAQDNFQRLIDEYIQVIEEKDQHIAELREERAEVL